LSSANARSPAHTRSARFLRDADDDDDDGESAAAAAAAPAAVSAGMKLPVASSHRRATDLRVGTVVLRGMIGRQSL